MQKINSQGAVFQCQTGTVPRTAALHSGAQGLRLPHLFQKYVSLDTSAFRYVVRSSVRGIVRALSLSLSFFVEAAFPLATTRHPPSQPAQLCPSPLEPGLAWLGGL